MQQNAGSAGQANGLAGTYKVTATADVVVRRVKAMGEIHASSSRIADITPTIDGSRSRPDLLALNAAVEAKRARNEGTASPWSRAVQPGPAQRTPRRADRGLIRTRCTKVDGATLVNPLRRSAESPSQSSAREERHRGRSRPRPGAGGGHRAGQRARGPRWTRSRAVERSPDRGCPAQPVAVPGRAAQRSARGPLPSTGRERLRARTAPLHSARIHATRRLGRRANPSAPKAAQTAAPRLRRRLGAGAACRHTRFRRHAGALDPYRTFR
ncbi:MAG: hypothetical protein H6825_04990 [Planctomycetes bacterium]|nr:hypothetical protein [Planctomycetota bacterium]